MISNITVNFHYSTNIDWAVQYLLDTVFGAGDKAVNKAIDKQNIYCIR